MDNQNLLKLEKAIGLVEEIKNCSLAWDDAHWNALEVVIEYVKNRLNKDNEKYINRSIMYLNKYNNSDSEVEKQGAQSCINWLEALRDDKLNDPKYNVGDKVRFFSDSEVFTISKVENGKYIFAEEGGDGVSIYEELIPVKESKDTLTRDKVKCGDYVVNKDGTVIKVHDIDNFGHVCYYYFANEMTEDGGKIQDNRAFMKYYGVIQDCHMATQREIDFLEKWVAHKKYIWVEDNVSPDDEVED